MLIADTEVKRDLFFRACETDATRIFVRTELRGVWGSWLLAELPDAERREWIEKWWTERIQGDAL